MLNKKSFILLILSINFLFAQIKENINLQLDWLHQFQFAGYYIAKEKGYYENNNLNVAINEFDYGLNLLDNVLKNKNTYSVGKSSLIIDKLQGKDPVLLAAIYQNSPMVLLSLKKNNISEISDLKNKKVMLTPDARAAASINSMIKSQGIKLEDINFIPHSFKLNDLINGKTDAMGCYLSNEPYILKNKNIEFDTFNPKEYGFNFYGGLLFTSKNEIDEHPNRVKNFYDASIKGWKYAFENIEETAKLIYDKYNTQNKTLDSLIFEGKVLKKLAKYDDGLLGNIDTAKIEEMKRLYLILGFSKNKDFEMKDFIFDKNSILFNISEKEYLNKNEISLITNSNNMPYSFKVDNLLSGLEIDFWQLISNKLNSSFNIIEKPKSDDVLKNINTNSVHIKFNYNKTSFNFDKYSLSNPITSIPIALATKNDKNLITDLSFLKDVKIAVFKNTDIFLLLKSKYPYINFIQIDSIHEAFELVEKDKIFGVIDNILTLSHNIIKQNYNNIKVSSTLPYNLELRLSVEKKDELLISVINKIIEQISEDEKNSIAHKYQLIMYQEVNDYSWVYKFVLPLFILLIIISIINTKMRKEIKKRKVAEGALLDYANKDSLTQVFNRRKIEKIMTAQIRKVKDKNSTFSIIFFDIDDFKIINDEFGHVKGDKVLISISKLVSKSIRKNDFIGRWGGEEFIIILPDTSSKHASKITHNLKELIAKKDFTINKTITSSFGITEYKKGDTKKDMIDRADKAMYYVKRNGKDAIKID